MNRNESVDKKVTGFKNESIETRVLLNQNESAPMIVTSPKE